MTRAALIVGCVGMAIAGAGWLFDSARFYGGWLAAVTLLTAWSLGCMTLLLTHALTGGRWGYTLRPALRIGVGATPLLLPAWLPILLGLSRLYPWARSGHHFYLNAPFFVARSVAYLLLWLGLGWLTLRDRNLSRIAPSGLCVLALTATFAAIDTTMSLDPSFVSSAYGMIAASGMALFALSVSVLLTVGEVAPTVREDFGKLLLALVVLWVYLDFMQLLIVWQSDLAADVPWYLERSRGFWGEIGCIIVAGHFVLPFFLLLSPTMQRSRPVLMGVTGLLVAMEVLRAWWTVLPAQKATVGWIDVACMIGLGGIALSFALWTADLPLLKEARHA